MSSYLAATPNHYLYYTSVFYSVKIDPKKFLFFFFWLFKTHLMLSIFISSSESQTAICQLYICHTLDSNGAPTK